MIDYIPASELYRPKEIKILLIGEAPPPSGKAYFYVPAINSRTLKTPIRQDRSLPSTIFYHYFQTRPSTTEEYVDLLKKLKEMGIWLIDVYEYPIKVRHDEANLEIIKEHIPKLRAKMRERNIFIDEKNMIFLLARNSYKSLIRQYYPNSKAIPWIDFRMQSNVIPQKLNLSIGGYPGPFYTLKLVEGKLIYNQTNIYTSEQAVSLEPSVEEWRAFETKLNQLKIWDWKAFYKCEDVLDGTSWAVDIRYSDKQITSEGSNAYPGSEEPAGSADFRSFLSAVRGLIGGLEFE